MIPIVACAALCIAVMLIVARLFAGPTLYDRLLATLSLLGKVSLIAGALSVALGQSAIADAALALAFASLILTAASMKFFHTRTFQAPIGRGARG